MNIQATISVISLYLLAIITSEQSLAMPYDASIPHKLIRTTYGDSYNCKFQISDFAGDGQPFIYPLNVGVSANGKALGAIVNQELWERLNYKSKLYYIRQLSCSYFRYKKPKGVKCENFAALDKEMNIVQLFKKEDLC